MTDEIFKEAKINREKYKNTQKQLEVADRIHDALKIYNEKDEIIIKVINENLAPTVQELCILLTLMRDRLRDEVKKLDKEFDEMGCRNEYYCDTCSYKSNSNC